MPESRPVAVRLGEVVFITMSGLNRQHAPPRLFQWLASASLLPEPPYHHSPREHANRKECRPRFGSPGELLADDNSR